mmetsp:Transcript_26766/g.76415  ORF Transcript_26766/g.76415 Transcript_26766/m.76415 type:complete len:584 (-) Transcript_26766:284-2035(-)
MEPLLFKALDDQLRLGVLAFFGVPDLGRYACCSRAGREDAGVDCVWEDVFKAALGPSVSRAGEVVGLRVSVFHPELDACLCGTVGGYRPGTNEYPLRSDAPRPGDRAREARERGARGEGAARSEPKLAARSRIDFLRMAREQVPAAADQAAVEAASFHVPGASSTAGAGRSRPHRFPTWREEVRHVAAHTPSRVLARLQDHSDEVLFASFSPCGTRLATSSRDRTTCIYGFGQDGQPALDSVIQHSSAVAHVQWCPYPELDCIAVSTDGPYPMAEVWNVGKHECLLRVLSPVRDVFASIVRWPTGGLALLASGAISVGDEYTQELCVYALPPRAPTPEQAAHARRGGRGGRPLGPPPLARLVLRGTANYFHCPEPASRAGGLEGRFAALTGTGSLQCDAVALFDLPSAEGAAGLPWGAEVELAPRTREMRGYAVLSARWAQSGRLLLVNARPRVEAGGGSRAQGGLRQPAPMLRMGLELLVLDGLTLDTLSVVGGHRAFTAAQAPFILHADAWADADIVASGGEDACVHVWHRPQGHQLARLRAHTCAVNAVTWSSSLRLMVSASDDHTAVVWACGGAAGGSP